MEDFRGQSLLFHHVFKSQPLSGSAQNEVCERPGPVPVFLIVFNLNTNKKISDSQFSPGYVCEDKIVNGVKDSPPLR
jgi:hypothetical protein